MIRISAALRDKNPFWQRLVGILLLCLPAGLCAAVCLPLLFSHPLLTAIPYWLFIFAASAFFFWMRGLALPVRFAQSRVMWAVLPLSAMAIRFVWVWAAVAPPLSDFRTYDTIARGFVAGEAVSAPYAATFPHVLGYPALLSLVYRLSDSILAGCLCNVLLSGLTVWLFQGLVRQVTGHTGRAFWAGLCLTVFPSHIYYTALLCTEILFVFLLVLLLRVYAWLWARPLPGRRLWVTSAGLGLLIFACHAVRPMGWLLVAALGFHWLFLMGGFRRLSHWVALGLMTLIFCAGIQWRDAAAARWLGQPVAQSPIGWNLFLGMSAQGNYNTPDEEAFTDFRLHNPDPQALHDHFLALGIARLQAHIQEGSLGTLFWHKWKAGWLQDGEGVSAVNNARQTLGLGDIPLSRWFRAAANGFYHALWGTLLLLCIRTLWTRSWNETSPLLFVPVLLLAGMIVLTLVFEANTRYHFTGNICLLLMTALWPGVDEGAHI